MYVYIFFIWYYFVYVNENLHAKYTSQILNIKPRITFWYVECDHRVNLHIVEGPKV